MINDIRKARIQTLEGYLQDELAQPRQHEHGADSQIYSLFLQWYAEPYMAGSRIRTVALAKRMLAELKAEQDVEVHGQA